jgi:hypothetical protein
MPLRAGRGPVVARPNTGCSRPLRAARSRRLNPTLGRRVGEQAVELLKSARDVVAQAQRNRSVMRRWSVA